MNNLKCTQKEIGPLPTREKPFARRMRQHQGWYRASVIGAGYGVGPKSTSLTKYANMLDTQAALEGANFLNPEIFEAAKVRLKECGGVMEEYRLMHNMLSSQPMCFNLFGYLGLHLGLATAWLNEVLNGQVKEVTKVIIEHNLEPRANYLNDKTAFDAFVEFTDVDNKKGFIGIETKLTEPFSQTKPPPDTPKYRSWMELPNSPWLEKAEDQVALVAHNQLWRDHLLAVATLHQNSSPYDYGALMLVGHGEDEECREVTKGYMALLKNTDNMFIDMPLHLVVGNISGCIQNDAQQKWLDDFKLRYLDLDASLESIS